MHIIALLDLTITDVCNTHNIRIIYFMQHQLLPSFTPLLAVNLLTRHRTFTHQHAQRLQVGLCVLFAMTVEGVDGEVLDVCEVGHHRVPLGVRQHVVEHSVQAHVLQPHLQHTATASVQHQLTSLQGRQGYTRLELWHYMIHNDNGE